MCVVDDAQWLDHASAQTLAAAARRLSAESVALVFAVRTSDDRMELPGLPELVIGGLDGSAARSLLSSVFPVTLDERVRDRIVAETGGNPLAILELPRGLTPEELASGLVLAPGRGLAGAIESSFARRLSQLPPSTRRLLLIASAEPLEDLALVRRTAERKLQRSRVRLALARAHLLYGEWLRRDHRHLAARNQLRTAHEMLTDMGIHAFAERAARELRATGATVRKPTAGSTGDLTPQETQIARVASEGLSNPEIGSRLTCANTRSPSPMIRP